MNVFLRRDNMFANEFILLCKDFTKKRNDVLDETFEETKKLCKYTIECNCYILEFRYIKKESAFFKPSSLYCVIHLRKNSVVYYHLTDIIPFLEHKTFKSCYFWNIESPERLNSCFESLTSNLEKVTSQLSPYLLDDSILLEALFDNYKTIYSLKETDIDFDKIEDPEDYAQSYFLSLQNMRDGYIFSRYCNFAPYALLLKSKVDKALEKYEKLNQKNKLLEYEKQLIKHITSSENGEFNIFEESCDTSGAEKLITPLSGVLEFLIVFAIASIFFCGIFAIYNSIISVDTLIVLSAPWYLGFLCAGLCSVFGAIALVANKPIPNRFLTKKERKDFSNILVSKGVKKFSFIIFVISIAVSIVFAIMILISNVRFYEDNISFENKTYSYDNIYSVYYIESRYNVYDERIERASYVILFDDKTSLDLDGFTSIQFTEQEVLPLLSKKRINIKSAMSEKELPWYTE